MSTVKSSDTFYQSAKEALADKIRRVPDFPEEGVLFEDLTPVLADADALRAVVNDLVQASKDLSLIHISEPTRHFKRSRMPSSA